ncbi:MAG TPA: Nif3-like dinuclear metal center hexameric protein [Candidatus Enterocloster faecavium]|uniref:GTP cyclohydrolase 1 type 2 homolog n=1 Tax=Candidatus Enterocloster faecavium TaxID=2838560 RepID=A0A9D2L886_9FIRM|nr:Nif3-like dinuclear metal center hexameric protein [Candidatus Enterocloster faecavium]
MKCSEIIAILRGLAPEEWACEWDNPGLIAGRMEKEVKRIFVALDATDQIVEEAVRTGADLLLTHHPLVFKAVKQVNDQNFITRRLLRLIQADISYYAMHTNFDAAPGCMADLAAKRIGILQGQPLEVMGEAEGLPFGIGKWGELEKPACLSQLAKEVKEKFGLPYVLVYGEEHPERKLTRAAVCPGSGGSEIEAAIRAGAEVLITGDISHHQGIDAAARGMAVIDGGHYGLEHIFVEFMGGWLEKQLGSGIQVIQAGPQWPARAY